jgi:hypothetical protein
MSCLHSTQLLFDSTGSGYKRRLKVRGRPPRGRTIEPSKLYQELTAFIEYLEVKKTYHSTLQKKRRILKLFLFYHIMK